MNEAVPIPEVGATLRGRIVRFLAHGALLEIGNGLKGLLHGSQVSWLNKRTSVNEVFKIGDELDVVVLEVRQSKKSKAIFVSLGHRQTQENPWETVSEMHPVGSRLKAKVVAFLPFGATVEFETGFRALVHDSELSWAEKRPKAKDFLRIGEVIEVVVQLVDNAKRRIHASHREATENPWATFLDRYPLGTTTTGTVVRVRDFGVFVMLSNGCVGLLHKSKFMSGVSEIPLGDTVGVVVLEYEPEKKRIAFGHASA